MSATLLPETELRTKRQELLRRIQGDEKEIYRRARNYMLDTNERAIFRQVEALDFILGTHDEDSVFSRTA